MESNSICRDEENEGASQREMKERETNNNISRTVLSDYIDTHARFATLFQR